MTDPKSDGSLRPPYAPELLADLHAGVLPTATAERLWPLARADRDAAATLAALDATTAQIRVLGAAPIESMPEFIAARLRRTLTEESAATPPPRPAAQSESTRSGSTRSGSAKLALAGAAAVVLGLAAYVGLNQFGPGATNPTAPGQPSAMAPTTDAPAGAIEISDGEVPATVVRAVRNTAVTGRLADPQLRAECLRANGYANGALVLGSGPVKVGERLGTLLVLPGERPPLVIALVVGDHCSASDPDLLAVNTVAD